jgi:hypothetical protein
LHWILSCNVFSFNPELKEPTVRKLLAGAVVVGILSGATLLQAPAQEGVGERIGEKVDRGIKQLGRELRDEWAELKTSVERMGVHGRVYSRLRWDKEVQGASIDLEVTEKGVVSLKGEVPSSVAKQKAVRLAQDTVGVTQVVDELAIEPPSE